MKKLLLGAAALALATTSALAAPNVANNTQKGSLLIFPDIRIDAGFNTLIRLQNDGSSDVDVICYWMDGNKNRVDLIFTLTRNQAFWFDARTGNGTNQVNRFPQSPANGFDNPFLIGPGGITEQTDNSGPYLRGMLACWAVDGGAQNQIKWNHLSGTATVYNAVFGSYWYNAYAFFVPTGLDLQPVGTAGVLNMNGIEYDSCPLYSLVQFTPVGAPPPVPPGRPVFLALRSAYVGCSLNLNQDWVPVFTKLQFDIWNEEEVKFTGAFECADSWHEIGTFEAPIDSALQNFLYATLGTFNARVRVQGVKSTQCLDSQAVGILGVQAQLTPMGVLDTVGTTYAAAGKFNGKIVWDPEGAVPEGGIR